MEMKELSLDDLQRESLKVLKEVHRFCVENNIKYSVAYGTLIGCIRHGGFIPWDDDIDVVMPRNHYDVFCKSFHSDKYKLSFFESKKDHYLAFARVYDDQYTTIDTVLPWCNRDVGVWIDIFPLDGCPDDEMTFHRSHDWAMSKWRKSITARTALGHFRKEKSLLFNIKLLLKKIFYLNGIVARRYVKQVIDFSKRIPFGATSHWSQLCCLDGYEYHSLEDFSSTILMRFEDMEVMVMNGYDNVLRECYGDYMLLPPPEQQVGNSKELTKFYWKN